MGGEVTLRRVAVYARVSTDREIQQSSLEEQLRSFQVQISQHPGWVLAGTYADEGLSGTGVRKRKAFLQMMADCEKGKIDYILTKSISRFARNTVECLTYVRRLQGMGVQLYFEKEGIDTASAVSEMLLTVLAAFAQEESRSISENLKWGLRKRFAKGVGRWTPTYGYRKAEDGQVVLQPEEAEIVRFLFERYRRGTTIPEIQELLRKRQVPAPRGGHWNRSSIKYLLQNEKYLGDSHLQKWVCGDHITHKSVPNTGGQTESYYFPDTHVPIIERHQFAQVQRILELRAPHGEYCRYPYCDTDIRCPLCGQNMVPQIMHSQARRRALCCFGPEGCRGYAIKTHLVDAALLEAYHRLPLEQQRCDPLDSVEYFWLEELVQQLEFCGDMLAVTWGWGEKTAVPMGVPASEEPTHVAALYRAYLERTQAEQAL